MQDKTNKDNVTAGVIIIGNEILSGRTQDVNLNFLAQTLNEHGIQVKEARIIPDLEDVIVKTVNTLRKTCDYVVTTGGIGPTHDDITADSIALALNLEIIVHPEIETMLHSRPASTEVMNSRLRMARVPKGARLVPSSVGPPGFAIENVFVLAGVPVIMRSMAESMVKMMTPGRSVKSRSIKTYLIESEIAKPLGELQNYYPDAEIGSYPFYEKEPGLYGTNIVMRSMDTVILDKLYQEVDRLRLALLKKYAKNQ